MPAEPAAQPLDPCPYCEADHGEATLRCPATDMVLPLAGRLLAGKFRLVAELGRGGMGAVWRAHNIHVERDVALKLILPEVLKNPEIVARFRDEARVAARIGHPGICDILDFELTPLGPVIVMELLRGENLGERISRMGRLPVPLAVGIITQALVALEAAHKAGIIHRDLKPENLFLHQVDPAPMVVKLMDFGISKFTDRASGLTGTGVIMGTPEYMAPEQISGAINADARTDLWAIGAMLYKAITGEDAFTGVSMPAVLLAITTGTPTPISKHVEGVPAGLSATILRCLARAPDKRFQSARELAQALQPYAAADLDAARVGSLPTLHSDAVAMPVASTLHFATPPARSPWPTRLLGLGLLAACGAGAWWYTTHRPELARHDELAITTPPTLVTTRTPPAAETLAHQPDDGRPGLLALWGLLGDDSGARAPGMKWLSTGLDGLTVALKQPLPIAALPTPTDDPPDTPAADPTAADPIVPEPAEPAEPPTDTPPTVPDPPRLITAGGHVTPSVAGKPGNQHWAKEYCGALDRNNFLGVDRWKLANPTQARLFAGVAGIKPGSYWTTANHKGVGLVIVLPRGNDRSITARKKSARPLCVATQP